ncbi:MAG TPA: hypothetical protein VNG53_06360, partial [Bacteroidia bacterium]|nr:hypothetical protein [Bacteroidia bacterium]
FDGRRSGTTHDKNKKLIYPIIYPDKLQKIDKISYVQLPLCNFYKDEQVYSVPDSMYGKSKMPKISITEIILGYRYNEDDLKNLKERIALFDPNINVKMSDLKQYY